MHRANLQWSILVGWVTLHSERSGNTFGGSRHRRSLTAPVKALGEIPPASRIFARFSPTDAPDPHLDSGDRSGDTSVDATPSAMRSDRRNVGRSTRTGNCLCRTRVPGTRAHEQSTLRCLLYRARSSASEGACTTIVGYGLTSPGRALGVPVNAWPWDGKRRLRVSAVYSWQGYSGSEISYRLRFTTRC